MTAVLLLFCLPLIWVDSGNGSSDFAGVVRSKFYVDKTMMIRDFLNESPSDADVKIITAPPRFGKSTVVDMLKRFFAVPVDRNGTVVPLTTTENYRLFCEPELDICKDKDFVEKHMGQYPVMHISYRPLSPFVNFKTLLEGLRVVVRKTFVQHEYLLLNSSLFLFSEEGHFFARHYNKTDQKLAREHVQYALIWLAELLFKHFGRKVIVLLDEFDAYCDKLLFGSDDEDNEEVIEFLGAISKSLLTYNHYLKKALLTGVLRAKGIGVPPTSVDIKDYRWLGDHEFSKYYGFSPTEVLGLTRRTIKNETKVKETQELLKQHYEGYRMQNRQEVLYSMSSVISFFRFDMKPDRYWATPSTNDLVEELIFKCKRSKDAIKQLLFPAVRVYCDTSRLLDRKDIADLRHAKSTQKEDFERRIVLLYELGYLSPTGGYLRQAMRPLKIPNAEIRAEFCEMLVRHYIQKYNYNFENIAPLHAAVDSFRPDGNNTEAYASFYQAANDLVERSEHHPRSENDINFLLFIVLATEFFTTVKFTPELSLLSSKNNVTIDDLPTALRGVVTDNYNVSSKTGAIKRSKARVLVDIALFNSNKMFVAIETTFQRVNATSSLDDLAKDSLTRTLVDLHPYLRHSSRIKLKKSRILSKGKVYIGVAYNMRSRDFSMAFYDPAFDKEPILINKSNL